MQKSQKYVRKINEHSPKMVPTPLQNRDWRGFGRHLGATLETRCFQDLIFDDLGSILGPPLGSVWLDANAEANQETKLETKPLGQH